MTKVGYEYLNQFEWNRTPQDNLNQILRSAFFERGIEVLHLPKYSGDDELPQGNVDLKFTFYLRDGNEIKAVSKY